MKKEFYNIANLVTKNAKILDVGCGNGELMKYITENISKDIRGIELSKSNVQKCVEKGLIVIENVTKIYAGFLAGKKLKWPLFF